MPKAGELPTLRVLRFLDSTTDATVLTIAHGVDITEAKARTTIKQLTWRGRAELTSTSDTGARCYGITGQGRAYLTANTITQEN